MGRKVRSNVPGQIALMAVALLWALALAGVAGAAWVDEVTVKGTVATGFTDVVFTAARVEKVTGMGHGRATVEPGGRTLSIEMEDAWRGTQLWVSFQVQNRGTIPVVAAPDIPLVPRLTVRVEKSPPPLAPGETGEGVLLLTVGNDLPAGAEITAEGVVLNFRQWNRQ